MPKPLSAVPGEDSRINMQYTKITVPISGRSGRSNVTVGAIATAYRPLAVPGTIDQQIAAQQSIVNSTEKTYLPATKRYDQGIGDYPGILDTQRSLYGRQRILLTLRPAKQVNQVNLYTVPDCGVDGGHASEVTKK